MEHADIGLINRKVFTLLERQTVELVGRKGVAEHLLQAAETVGVADLGAVDRRGQGAGDRRVERARVEGGIGAGPAGRPDGVVGEGGGRRVLETGEVNGDRRLGHHRGEKKTSGEQDNAEPRRERPRRRGDARENQRGSRDGFFHQVEKRTKVRNQYGPTGSRCRANVGARRTRRPTLTVGRLRRPRAAGRHAARAERRAWRGARRALTAPTRFSVARRGWKGGSPPRAVSGRSDGGALRSAKKKARRVGAPSMERINRNPVKRTRAAYRGGRPWGWRRRGGRR
jgi:hypothetical protein